MNSVVWEIVCAVALEVHVGFTMKERLALTLSLLLASMAYQGCAGPLEDDVTGEAALNVGDEAEVNVDGLNLRAGPGTQHAVLTVMSRGDRVRARGASQDGFAPVVFDGQEGWAFEQFLTFVGPRLPPPPPGSLGETISAVAAEVSSSSPGTELGIAVLNLSTGEYAGSGDDVRHVSASSAKVMWVAAAMRAGATVSDIAGPIFASSDNHLAGTAIDRAGGIDAVNEFYWNVAGMETSLTANWSFGRPRHATNQGLMGGDNYFTPRDVITFLSRLDRGELLGDRTDELRHYLTLSPDAGFGAWIGTLLPGHVQGQLMHKAGWLPPPDFAAYSTMNAVGIVQVPDGHRYAIALLARQGSSYERQGRFMERASCLVYRSVSGDGTLACRD